MQPNALHAWHEVVRTRDVRALDALLAENAVFHSPVVHTPQVGKALTSQYLRAAMHVFSNETFHYVREIADGQQAMLEFEVVMDGVHVNGIDVIHWNEQGLIDDFKVFIRPLKGIQAVHARMAAMLQARP